MRISCPVHRGSTTFRSDSVPVSPVMTQSVRTIPSPNSTAPQEDISSMAHSRYPSTEAVSQSLDLPGRRPPHITSPSTGLCSEEEFRSPQKPICRRPQTCSCRCRWPSRRDMTSVCATLEQSPTRVSSFPSKPAISRGGTSSGRLP